MSLRPDHRSSRSRSKSRERSKSRSRTHERAPSPGPALTADARYSYASPSHDVRAPSPVSALTHDMSQYEIREPSQPAVAMPQPVHAGNPYERISNAHANDPNSHITMGDFADLPPHLRPAAMAAAAANAQSSPPLAQYAQPVERGQHQEQAQQQYQQGQSPQYPQQQQYGYTSNPPYPHGSQSSKGVVALPDYAAPATFQYAAPPDKITYTAKPQTNPKSTQPQPQQPQHAQYLQYAQHPQYAQQPQHSQHPQHPQYQQQQQQQQYAQHQQHQQHQQHPQQYPAYSHNAHAVEVPSGKSKTKAGPSSGLQTQHLDVNGKQREEDGTKSSKKTNRLSVSGNRPDVVGYMPGQFPPASPLLEAYHGTYQSISPMPSPYLLPDDDIDDLPPLSPTTTASSDRSRGKRSKSKSKIAEPPPEQKKRVKVYDAEDDALALVDALTQSKLDADTLVDILPALTHDQMLELRTEYKKHCKVQGRGINLAKHIKLKTTSNFGKICHVTALGRWESEGYWANFWYQSNSARRELLIEALMGRSNADIRAIKEAFKDKRYGDSLVKCMDKELKADKFRTAVLLALEEKRQEEHEAWPMEYRNRDVDALYSAIKRREGGESAIIQIVVMRSDSHLREVLKTYERKYQSNFARDALKKSNNLVGELIAHILNGVINRPARDAMLLNHALEDLQEAPPSSRSSDRHERQDRYELLISRLVRLHWDRLHLTRVKSEYMEKYRRHLQEDIEEATRGDFCEFCLALCEI